MYNSIIVEHAANPRNTGEIPDASAIGTAGVPGHGPFFQIWLKIESNKITGCSFKSFGCGPAIAAGSVLTEWAHGRTLKECLGLTDNLLTKMLGGLPEEKEHCSYLAVQALQNCVHEYLAKE